MLIVYTKNNCPYCVKAKGFLNRKNIAFTERNIEENPQYRQFLKSQGHSTVPQIYKGDHLFVQGGADGLVALTDAQLKSKIEA